VSGRRAGLLALALLVLASCSVGPPRTSPGAVEIAIDLPLTGPQATEAQAALDQARSVVDGVYGGRVEGLPIRLRVLDEGAGGGRDPVQAANQLSQALASGPLLGVIGPLDSDVAEAEIPVVSSAGVAMLSPTASAACLTRPLPECDGLAGRLRAWKPVSFFRLAPPDDGEAAALVQFAVDHLQSSKFAIASDGQAYGLLLRSRFEAALKKQHRSAVFSANLDPTSDAAIDSFLATAKQAGADTVLFGGRAAGGACRVAPRLAAGLGPSAALLGGGDWVDSSCAADAGTALPSVYSVREGSTDQAAIAARVLLEAVATAVKAQGGNLPSREQVRAAVARGSRVRFDANGDPLVKSYQVCQGGTGGWTVIGSATG